MRFSFGRYMVLVLVLTGCDVVDDLSEDENEDSDSAILSNGSVSGRINFSDSSFPETPWVRITPSEFQVDGEWRSINCEVFKESDSVGVFGDENCWAHVDVPEALEDQSDEFQIEVYRESTGDHRYNGEEELYCFLNLAHGSWEEFVCSSYQDSYDGISVSHVDPIVAEGQGYNQDALVTPNGGEAWNDGEIRTIEWETSSITGATVDLYVLYDDPNGLFNISNENAWSAINSKVWYKFAASVQNIGAYTFDAEAMNGTGNAYVVLVVSTEDNSQFDISDDTFSLNYVPPVNGLDLSSGISVSHVDPTSAVLNTTTTFTIYGENFPLTGPSFSLYDADCGDVYNLSSTQASIDCVPLVSGEKKFYVPGTGVPPIDGWESLSVDVSGS